MKIKLTLTFAALFCVFSAPAFAEVPTTQQQVQTLKNQGLISGYSEWSEFPHYYVIMTSNRSVTKYTGFSATTNYYRVDVRNRTPNPQGQYDQDSLIFYEWESGPHALKVDHFMSAKGAAYTYYLVLCKQPVDRVAGFWRIFYMSNSPSGTNQCILNTIGAID